MDLEGYRHWLHDQLRYWRERCYDEAEAKGFSRQPRHIKYATPEARATYEAIGECHDKFIDATYPDPPTPPPAVILDVPFYSQQPANPYVNDCGPACVRMVWGYWRRQRKLSDARDVTVQDFAEKILTSPRDTANNADLVRLAARYGMTLVSSNGPELTPERIRQEIDAGHPVIALVMYDELPVHFCEPAASTRFAHYIVIVGYDQDHQFCYLDPLDTAGAQHSIASIKLIKALNPGPNKYFSVPYQGVFYAG